LNDKRVHGAINESPSRFPLADLALFQQVRGYSKKTFP
jgi:hypothetical protein